MTTENLEAFFEMPLSKWNLFESSTLKRSKMVLLNDLNPVVDMFNADEVGVGGRSAQEVIAELGLSPQDRERIMALMEARSFDVYSVRAVLAEFLNDEELERIAIPDEEKKRLESYLSNYSRTLLKAIVEGANIEVTSRASLTDLFEGPSREIVLKNVVDIAAKLRIEPNEIVAYISKLTEIILAISYYKRVYDSMKEDLQTVLMEIKRVQDEKSLYFRFQGLKEETRFALTVGRGAMMQLDRYFEEFDKLDRFFEVITPEAFRQLKEGVEQHYHAIGVVLCFWQIKISEFRNRWYDKRGRTRDLTAEQRYNFFKDTVFFNIRSIVDKVEYLESADLGLDKLSAN